MLKILVYDTNFVPGISRVIPVIKIKYWQEHDCQVTIFGTKDAESFYKSKLKGLNYLSLDFKYKVKNPYSLIWEVIKINFLAILKIKEVIGKYDLVYSQSSVIDFLFIPWLLKFLDKKIKWFVMVDNIVPPPNRRPGSFIHNLIPYIAFLIGDGFLRQADGIFVVTDYLKNHYLKLDKTRVVKTNNGYGIQADLFTGEIPIDTPKVNGLYCGRLHIAKGIFDLIEVVKLVAKQKPNFKMGILGDGSDDLKKKFLEKIKEDNLEKNFIFFGFVADKRKGDIYRKCDFLISLSYDEGFGHSILEALACNKPVIAYDLPVYREVFAKYVENKQLMLFEKKDFSGLSKDIIKEGYKKLKFNNNLENYDWDIICQKELESFTKI